MPKENTTDHKKMRERFQQHFKCAFAKTKVFNVEELLDFFEKEKQQMLAELQAICDRDENEGGRLLLEEYKESK